MKTIIVDDEIIARQRISNLLQKIKGFEIIAECSNGTSAIQEINHLKPALIFLDINIRDMDGFQVLEQINYDPKPMVIFITAHDNFAVKAFDFDAIDYLVKPFKEDRFYKTIDKLLSQNSQKDESLEENLKSILEKIDFNKEKYIQKLAVRHGNKTILVSTNNINYIISSGVYVEIFTSEGMYLHRETLNNLEQMLNPSQFFRVHRSAIVNLNSVKEIIHSDFSEIDAKMNDNKLISISKNQKKEFLNKLGL